MWEILNSWLKNLISLRYEPSLSMLVVQVQMLWYVIPAVNKLKRSQLCHFLYTLDMRWEIADALRPFHFPLGDFLDRYGAVAVQD